MTVPPPLAEIHALVKRYGAQPAVEGVDLAVAPGEIVGLLGRNGAGKTTILECLLGLRAPDAGNLRLAGIDVRTAPAAARTRVGAQVQPAELQPKITPREALTFFAAFYRDAADVGELLTRFGLVEKAGARFDTLSAGQRQRLALALAFVNRPALLVLDEPTTGLDPQTRRALHDILVAHRASGGGVLLGTHDLDEAQRLCDRVAILHRGRLVALDRPAALVARSGAATRIAFRTSRPLTATTLASLPGACGTDRPSGDPTGSAEYALRTHEPARTVAELSRLLAADGNAPVELHLQPPALEEVFVALTGENWDHAPEARA